MKLFNNYLGPASDTLLDLGQSTFRWKNLFISGVMSSGTIFANTVNTITLFSTSAQIVGLATTAITVNSVNVISERFTQSVGSSLILSNSARSYLNVRMLTHNAVGPADGDVWFQVSSNAMYLAIRSNNANYYVQMNS